MLKEIINLVEDITMLPYIFRKLDTTRYIGNIDSQFQLVKEDILFYWSHPRKYPSAKIL